MKIGILGSGGSIGKRHCTNAHYLRHEVWGYDPIYGARGRQETLDQCDAIVVASPSQYHGQDLVDAVNAGKHVLVEKPFGYDCPPYLDGFVQASRHANPSLIIATGFNLRFHACIQYIKTHLSEIGTIRFASFSVLQKSEKPEYLRDGLIRNWLSHEIDVAHYLLGKGAVEECTGDDQKEIWIRMHFPNVTERVYIHGDYLSKPHQRYFSIEGSEGSFMVNLEAREVYKKDKHGMRTVHVAEDNWDQNYLSEMGTFIASIEQGQHLQPLATGEDGVRALYTVMAARKKAGLTDGT